VVNASGRIPRHLYILPGGVAEIFLSTPGKHEIITSRKGLMRLALETGTSIFPCYVFGGTDFFNNLATGDNFFSRFSRRYRMGLALFYGQFGLPMVPYAPRVTLCIADAIEVKKWEGEGPVPQELIEELQEKYAKAFQELFEKYKGVAGYPDSVLKVQ
jgi:diacylglycerol O-acyltransferase 2, plant